MAILDLFCRSIKKYIFSLESIILLCVLIIVCAYICNGNMVWDVFERLRVKLELVFSGEYDRVPALGDKIISAEKTKASWELRKDIVGVYAIQGRRPHMEDRFNVVSELEHTNTSIFGIFDGHGGEVYLALCHL